MLTTLTQQNDVVSAYIIKGRLEAEGIPAVVFHAHFMQAHSMLVVPVFNAARGGALVKVSDQDLQEAKVVMQQIESGHYELTDAEIDEINPDDSVAEPQCPNCHAHDGILNLPGRRTHYLILMYVYEGAMLLAFWLYYVWLNLNWLSSRSLFSIDPKFALPFGLGLALIPALLPFRFKNRYCNNCKHRWYEKLHRPLSKLEYFLVGIYTNLAAWIAIGICAMFIVLVYFVSWFVFTLSLSQGFPQLR